MKKLFFAAIILAVLAAPVFSQVRVRVYGQAAFLPLIIQQNDEEDMGFYSGLSSGVSQRPPRIRTDITGTAGGSGVRLRLNLIDSPNQFTSSTTSNVIPFENTVFSPYIDDWAVLWIQPASWLRLDAGMFKNDELRGRVGRSLLHRYILETEPNQDSSFHRFETNAGVMASITPIKDLFIGVMLGSMASLGDDVDPIRAPGLGTNTWDPNNLGLPDFMDIGRTWKNVHVGVGYKISGFNIRAQFIGQADPTFRVNNPNPADGPVNSAMSTATGRYIVDRVMTNRIEAAVSWSPSSDLILDLGGKIPLPTGNIVTRADFYAPESPDDTLPYGRGQPPYQLSFTGEFTIEDLSLSVRLDGMFGGWYEYVVRSGSNARHVLLNQDLDLFARLMGSYNLGSLIVGGEFGFQYTSPAIETEVENPAVAKGANPLRETAGGIKFGVGAWVQLNLTNAFLQTGITFQPPVEYDGLKTPLYIIVPVVFRVSI